MGKEVLKINMIVCLLKRCFFLVYDLGYIYKLNYRQIDIDISRIYEYINRYNLKYIHQYPQKM